MQGENAPLLCSACYTVNGTFLRIFPPPCFRVVSIWTELNLEISAILYSNCLSNEVDAPVDKNALALCERRKEQ